MRRRGRRNVAKRRTPSPKKNASGPRRMPNKLFIGNLSKTLSKSELEHEFRRFGRLQDVWLSQKPPGFGFVEFLNSKDASACVQALDGRQLFGSRLRVEFAKNEPPKHAVKRQGGSGSGGGGGRARSGKRSALSPARRGVSPLDVSRHGGTSSIATARLLPPPKSMLQSLYDRSPPSPLTLLRQSRAMYDDVAVGGTWEDTGRHSRVSSSLLLRGRSRSPRARSPIGSLPALGREALSAGGRLLAPPPLPPPPPPMSSMLFTGSHGDLTPPHLRSRYGSRGRSPQRFRSRSPLGRRSRSPLRTRSRSRQRLLSRSPSHLLPRLSKTRLLGRTPPLPDRSPSPKHFRRMDSKDRGGVGSLPRRNSRSFSRGSLTPSPPPYSRSRCVAGAYTPPSPPPVKRSSSRSRSYTRSPPPRKHVSPPPKAYALPSDQRSSRSWSRSRSVSSHRRMVSLSPRKISRPRSSSSPRSPPSRYARIPPSPSGRRGSPANVKREAMSPPRGSMIRGGRSVSRSPVRRQRSPSSSVSPAAGPRHRSPKHVMSSHQRSRSPTANSLRWSPVPRRAEPAVSRSRRTPALSPPVARNGRRSPVHHARSPPVSDRRSPRRHR